MYTYSLSLGSIWRYTHTRLKLIRVKWTAFRSPSRSQRTPQTRYSSPAPRKLLELSLTPTPKTDSLPLNPVQCEHISKVVCLCLRLCLYTCRICVKMLSIPADTKNGHTFLTPHRTGWKYRRKIQPQTRQWRRRGVFNRRTHDASTRLLCCWCRNVLPLLKPTPTTTETPRAASGLFA